MANFTWIGASVGYLTVASNWDDLTTGQDPSPVVPGALDNVTLGNAEVFGSGQLASATNGSLDGTFTIGTVFGTDFVAGSFAVRQYVGSNIYVGAGYTNIQTLSLSALNDSQPEQVIVDGTLDVGSTNVIFPYEYIINVGSTGALDIGGTLNALGNLIIGKTATLNIDLAGSSYPFGYHVIEAPTLDVLGTIKTSYTDFEASEFNNFGGSVIGSGQIEVLSGGYAFFDSAIDSSNLNFVEDSNANLVFAFINGVGPTITMAGNDYLGLNGLLDVVRASPTISAATVIMTGGTNDISMRRTSGNPENVTLSGFAPTDEINLQLGSNNYTGSSVTYMNDGANLGVLDVYNGGSLLGSIVLEGDYSTATFDDFNGIITVTEPPPTEAVTLNPATISPTITTPINTYGLVGTYGGTPEPIGAALFGAPGTNFTIQNKTLIESDSSNSFAAGIVLTDSGTITNTGTIIGANGIDIFDAGNTSGAYVENTNFIDATLATGIYLQANGSALNTGFLKATTTGENLAGGGYAYNSGTITAATGIALRGGTGNYAYNSGLISTNGDGILLAAPGYVSNTGTIIAGGDGIHLTTSASAYNSGTIIAATGIALDAGGTVTDHGTITALTGDAISFATGAANLLIIDAAAKFTNPVNGGGGELELQATPKTTGIFAAGQFTNFTTIAIDKAATWDITGATTLATTIINNGTIKESATDTLTLTGALEGTGLVKLGKKTLTLDGPVATTQKIAFSGTSETLNLGDPSAFAATINSFALGDTIDLTGIARTSITKSHFAGGVLTLTEATGKIKMTFASPKNFGTETLTLFKDGAGTGIRLAAVAAFPAANPWYGAALPAATSSYASVATPGPLTPTPSWSTLSQLIPTATFNS
jgi:hypothetical protein